MKRVLLLSSLLALAGAGFWALQTQAQPQDLDFEAFLHQVDVDGDCVNTAGDRAVIEWWCANGGNFESIEAAAILEDGVCNVQAFLNSPEAQLP